MDETMTVDLAERDYRLRPEIHRDDWSIFFPRPWIWTIQTPVYSELGLMGSDPVEWGRRFTRWGAERALERAIARVCRQGSAVRERAVYL